MCYVINDNLIFNASNNALANGVSFGLLGSAAPPGAAAGSPGAISWTNYFNIYALKTPTTGPTANILFWQTC